MSELDMLMNRVASTLLNTITRSMRSGDEHALTLIRDAHKNITDLLIDRVGDITKLPLDDLISLGFVKWKDDLYLVPVWLFEMVPDGVEFTKISGGTVVKGVGDIDIDSRMGMLSFGFDRKTYGLN